MSGKTLVAYASKGGVTRENAEIIAETLREKGFEVDLADLGSSRPDITPYANVIVGGGVRVQRVYRQARSFLKKDFGERKVAWFVCSLEVGEDRKSPDARRKYITNLLAKYPNLKVVDSAAFGGRMNMFGKRVPDFRDPELVKKWAASLASKLK